MKMDAYLTVEHMNTMSNRANNKMKTVPGLWIDGKTHWLIDEVEKLLPDELLTIKMKKRHVHSHVDLYDMNMTNHSDEVRQCKIMFAHYFVCATRDHFTFISPVDQVIFHLAGEHIYLASGHYRGKTFTEATVQPYWDFQADNIWSKAKQGVLRYQPMAKGATVSIIGMEITLMPKETVIGTGWLINGEKKERLLQLNSVITKTY